ncbi:hypothetical protein HK096_001245 [Nowakowskiella sp. JEL0078]|nr:hypothetical protein HK096_001245 [Nowakowskiella sp. JEL0078]
MSNPDDRTCIFGDDCLYAHDDANGKRIIVRKPTPKLTIARLLERFNIRLNEQSNHEEENFFDWSADDDDEFMLSSSDYEDDIENFSDFEFSHDYSSWNRRYSDLLLTWRHMLRRP